jgi:hypothetical protein
MTKTGILGLALVLLLMASVTQAGPGVPELDPGAASTGVALLIGGLAVFVGRRRKR